MLRKTFPQFNVLDEQGNQMQHDADELLFNIIQYVYDEESLENQTKLKALFDGQLIDMYLFILKR